MMKKSILLLLLCCFFMIGCTQNDSDDSINVETFNAVIDYGNHISDEAILLLDGSIIPFSLSDYDIDKIYAGDKVSIFYTGEMFCLETYPSQISISGEIVDVKVEKATKINCEFLIPPGGNKPELVAPQISAYYPNVAEYIILDDASYVSIDLAYQFLEVEAIILDDKITYLYAHDVTKEDFLINDSPIIEPKTVNEVISDLYNVINGFDEHLTYTLSAKDFKKTYFQDDLGNITYQTVALDGLHNNDIINITNDIIRFYKEDGILFEYSNQNQINYYRKQNSLYEQKIIELVSKYESFENLEVYDGYEIEFYQIDPGCGGPITLKFNYLEDSTQSFEFDIMYDINPNLDSIFPNLKMEYMTYLEYYTEAKIKANQINFEGEFDLLDKGPLSGSNYIFNPGFGITSFIDKKYEAFHNPNLVIYSIQNFPDAYFSEGELITNIYISDKTVKFNGLSLENSLSDIKNHFTDLGYEITNNTANSMTLYNGYIFIIINYDSSTINSIRFAVKCYNVLGIEY